MAGRDMLNRLATLLGVNPRKLRAGLAERAVRRIPARWIALYYLWRVWQSPAFGRALEVVQAVSQDPSSRNLDTWTGVNRLTVSNPKWGENMYRGLSARVKFGLTSPEAALLLELAYLTYKRRKRV